MTRQPDLLRQLAATPPTQHRRVLATHIREQAGLVMGLPPGTFTDLRQPLNTLGLDSLMAVELRNALSRNVGATLPATLVFDYPTIEALVDYLSSDVLHLQTEAPAQERGEPVKVADDLVALTDEEAEALLLQELLNVKKKGS